MVPKAANTGTRWRYVPLMALKKDIQRGISQLGSIVR